MARILAEAYLALGSNLGDRREQLRRALSSLSELGVQAVRVSSLYESDPMYVANQPTFLNAVLQAETELNPEELLRVAKLVEQRLGRRPRQRFGPREIDIDILTYGLESRHSDELTLPHPRMAERPFVQIPLAELRGEPLPDGTVRCVEGPEWASA